MENSFSDHRTLCFELSFDCVSAVEPKPNLKKTDWTKFGQEIRNSLSSFSSTKPGSREELDSLVDQLTSVLTEAIRSSSPTQRFQGKQRPPWWGDEVKELRSTCRRSFNRAKRSRSDEDWMIYKTDLRKFKYCIRKCKRESWTNFCTGIETSSEASRLRKILSKSPHIKSNLLRCDGTWTSNSQEIIEVLLDTHFPSNALVESRTEGEAGASTELTDRIISMPKITWAVNSFQPFKSPGPDGLAPVMLQAALPIMGDLIMTALKSCLALSHIPNSWTVTRVVFIPKAGKASHTSPKDFRPISLSSFFLKTLERLIDLYLKQTIDPKALSNCQHAYSVGRSTETALHSLVGHLEKHLELKEFSLVAFLDIEGAFNNVLPTAITNALEDLKVEDPVIGWIGKLLRSRSITAEWGPSRITKTVNRGTPQGGVLSPTLWNMVVNTFLLRMRRTGCRVVAYADDVTLTFSGRCPQTLSDLMTGSLSTLSSWAESCGLGINPGKTEVVLFTRKYKPPKFTPPKVNGEAITLKSQAKYLGLILDSKLSWKQCVEERARKAQVALYSCKKAIGKRWGFKPKVVHWLYGAVILPILMYGVIVWWPALEKSTYTNRLQRVQRSAGVAITGALRTTPTIALEAMLNLLPLDLVGRKLAASAAIRLSSLGFWKRTSGGHGSILRRLGPEIETVDKILAKSNFEPPAEIAIPSRKDWVNGKALDGHQHLIFTDGSKLLGKVGGGIFSETLDLNLAFRLPDHCSVFQAEVHAIKAALDWLRRSSISLGDICILSDSQAALKALNSVRITSRTVDSCLQSLRETAEQHNIYLKWVPGHRDIEGNCRADELARKGTTLPLGGAREATDMPHTTYKTLLLEAATLTAEERWRNSRIARTAKATWPSINANRTSQLLRLNRQDLCITIGILTGHCLIGEHARRLGVSTSDRCVSCNQSQASSEHLMCSCPALMRARLKHLGRHTLPSLNNLSQIRVSDVLRFIKSSNWFE